MPNEVKEFQGTYRKAQVYQTLVTVPMTDVEVESLKEQLVGYMFDDGATPTFKHKDGVLLLAVASDVVLLLDEDNLPDGVESVDDLEESVDLVDALCAVLADSESTSVGYVVTQFNTPTSFGATALKITKDGIQSTVCTNQILED